MTEDVRALTKELHDQIEKQFNILDQSLSERDHLSLLTTLHSDRLHADDLATVEEAVEYIDALHLKLHAFLPAFLDALERQPAAITPEMVETAMDAEPDYVSAGRSVRQFHEHVASSLNSLADDLENSGHPRWGDKVRDAVRALNRAKQGEPS